MEPLGRRRDGVVIDPAVPDATDDTDPTTTVPQTTTSTSATATPDPDVGPGRAPDDPGTTTPTTEAPEPPPSTCTGQVAGTGITFTATVPSNWRTNEAALGEPACHHFGPLPIELEPTETEAGEGVASNAVVKLYVSMGPGPKPTSFDQAVVDETAIAESARRTTVDGRPAARFERTTSPGDDVPVGGDRYVHWMIDLGDVWFDAVTLTGPDVPYDTAATAVDDIVESLRSSA